MFKGVILIMDKRNNVFIGCTAALICEFLFGLSYIFTKQATSVASELSLLGWRFFIAFIIINILVLLGVIKINLKGKNLKPLLIIAIFDPLIYFLAETIGINHTTASESGSFLACIPVISLLASTLILKKKPTKNQFFGIIVTLIGVLITVLAVGMETSFSPLGYLALLMAVISYALYCVFVEKTPEFTEAEITYAMLFSGAILFVILAFTESAMKGNISTLVSLPITSKEFLIAILYQGIGCSIVAFFMSNIAIANIGVNRTSSFIGIATVVSIIAGVVILKESFTLPQIIGVVFIVAGVYIANIGANSN